MDRGKMRGKCGEKKERERENETRRERRGYTMGRRRDNVCAGRRVRVRERGLRLRGRRIKREFESGDEKNHLVPGIEPSPIIIIISRTMAANLAFGERGTRKRGGGGGGGGHASPWRLRGNGV